MKWYRLFTLEKGKNVVNSDSHYSTSLPCDFQWAWCSLLLIESWWNNLFWYALKDICHLWINLIHSLNCVRNFSGPFSLHGLTLIPAWISNHMPSKVWDEISYPFPNFNSCTVEVWEWISNFIPHFTMDVITYPWHLFNTKPLPESVQTYWQLNLYNIKELQKPWAIGSFWMKITRTYCKIYNEFGDKNLKK